MDKVAKHLCKYCKHRVVIQDGEKQFSDRCRKFVVAASRLHPEELSLAFDARKDEKKCGPKGKYFQSKYF